MNFYNPDFKIEFYAQPKEAILTFYDQDNIAHKILLKKEKVLDLYLRLGKGILEEWYNEKVGP